MSTYLIGSGPMLLGHGHPEVVEAVHRTAAKGHDLLCQQHARHRTGRGNLQCRPCAEQVRYRLHRIGEADMYAMRLARAFTGRDKILKFEGGYHGMSAEAQMSLAPLKCW
jgi:glutamate-1-semialdehyde 2,1-aminomutase